MTAQWNGVLTGKGLAYGGSLARPKLPATVCATSPVRCSSMQNFRFNGKTVVISGSGNVATYAAEKARNTALR